MVGLMAPDLRILASGFYVIVEHTGDFQQPLPRSGNRLLLSDELADTSFVGALEL